MFSRSNVRQVSVHFHLLYTVTVLFSAQVLQILRYDPSYPCPVSHRAFKSPTDRLRVAKHLVLFLRISKRRVSRARSRLSLLATSCSRSTRRTSGSGSRLRRTSSSASGSARTCGRACASLRVGASCTSACSRACAGCSAGTSLGVSSWIG